MLESYKKYAQRVVKLAVVKGRGSNNTAQRLAWRLMNEAAYNVDSTVLTVAVALRDGKVRRSLSELDKKLKQGDNDEHTIRTRCEESKKGRR